MFKINLHLIEYAINSILRAKTKNIFITIIFTLLVFLLSSIFFISNSIKYELNQTINSLPQIIVQNIKGGKSYDIPVSVADKLLDIKGVSDAIARVWGYYYFKKAGVNFSLVGINSYETQYKKNFDDIVDTFDLHTNSMVVGVGVKKILEDNYYQDYFNFIKPNGEFKKLKIAGIFKEATQLESNDLIIMSQDNLRDIFDMKNKMATDIVVKVNNPVEIPMIVSKIKLLYPSARIITNEDLKISYQNIFDYKSGIFLTLFIISLFTFFMIIYDKASGLTSEQKKEIGILKAIGWTIDDILKEKFIEGLLISLISYLLGVLLAFIFVYILQAPLLRDIFEGYSILKTNFVLPFVLDFQTIFLVFFLSVPIYIFATIIPSWKIATLDADEAIR
jgi:ABC-type lipoprotein release transport system permease subunit